MSPIKQPTELATAPQLVFDPSPSHAQVESSTPTASAQPSKTSVPTCQIQWVGSDGQPTPDSNLSIGRVRRERYFHTLHGRTLEMPQTEWFYICTHHAHQLKEPGMEHWTFEPLAPLASSDEPSNAPAAPQP